MDQKNVSILKLKQIQRLMNELKEGFNIKVEPNSKTNEWTKRRFIVLDLFYLTRIKILIFATYVKKEV